MSFNTDFTKIIKKEHEGKWIALSEDGKKVLASSDTLIELKQKVGDIEHVTMKVPRSDVSYAFSMYAK